jgi:predicted MPP superfamily phosphohydrolase
MKLFYQIIIVHILFNLYVFWRGWKILPDKKLYKYSFAGIFLIEFLLFLLGFIGGNNLPPALLRTIFFIGFSWAVFIFYMVIFLVLQDVGKFFYLKITKKPKIENGLKLRRYYYSFSVLLTFLLMIWGHYTYLHPSVVERDIVIYKNTPELNQLRIVVASDLHIGIVSDKPVVQRYVDLIMQQNPDIIFLPGDIIDYDVKPLIAQHIDEDLKMLQAPYGVYACTGNHEYYADGGDKIRWLKDNTHIIMLQDSVAQIANSLYVVGREDPRSPEKTMPLKDILEGIDRDLPVFVLNHRPDDLNEEVDNNVDMAFYGHTHAGQVFPLNCFLKILFELPYGYMQKQDTHLFVSSGLGVGGPEYRIGTRSEILVVDVKFSSNY